MNENWHSIDLSGEAAKYITDYVFEVNGVFFMSTFLLKYLNLNNLQSCDAVDVPPPGLQDTNISFRISWQLVLSK